MIYHVVGNSMIPQYASGDIVIARRLLLSLKKNDVVICTHPITKRTMLKRIGDVQVNSNNKSTYFVIGDNVSGSTDSRQFGWIEKKAMLGKVLFRLR